MSKVQFVQEIKFSDLSVDDLGIQRGPNGRHSAYETPAEVTNQLATIANLVNKVERKEDVYVKVLSGKHEGAIGFVKKIKEHNCKIEEEPGRFNPWVQWHFKLSVIIGFSGRKNTATIHLADFYRSNSEAVYLKGYTGETVYTADRHDVAIEKINSDPVHDMRGNELTKGSIVVFINARYGSGASLDYGVIKEIKTKLLVHSGDYETVVIVSNIAKNPDGTEIISKIKNPGSYILNVTGTDIESDVVLAKLEA